MTLYNKDPKANSRNSNSAMQARELKHRVLTCLHRLSERDTHAAAAAELEAIAGRLPPSGLPSFISSIAATDASDKSPVRRQCVRLVAVLAARHGDALSPHLSRILSAVARRLRDPDSSVRGACVAAALALAAHLTSPPFNSVAKPFLESLFVEQEPAAQNAAALCLAAVVEGSRNPDVAALRKLLPRLQKLANCDTFKAKPAILALLGTLVAVEGVLGRTALRNLIACFTDFLSSQDWAARKAAAEALIKMAALQGHAHALSEYKAACFNTFQAKRFDKVKAARETMNQMLEAWKDIPDLTDHLSSKEIGSDGRCSKTDSSSQVKKSSPHGSPSPSPAPAAGRRTSLGSNGNRTSPPMFRKLDSKKPSNSNTEVAVAAPTISLVSEDVRSPTSTCQVEGRRYDHPEIRRPLFNDKQNHSNVVSDEAGDMCRNQGDCEDLSLIRKQLLQIENQQSNLLDILQRFIGSSQRGIHSLEARVHGLELALDEISFDLAVSTRKMSTAGASCCSLPGADFLNSKLRRRTQTQAPSQLPGPASCGTPSLDAAADAGGGITLQNRRRPLRGGHGVIVMNPLADIPLREASLKGHA